MGGPRRYTHCDRSLVRAEDLPFCLTLAANASTVEVLIAEGGRDASLRVEYRCSVPRNRGCVGFCTRPVANTDQASSTVWTGRLFGGRSEVQRCALHSAGSDRRGRQAGALRTGCLFGGRSEVHRRAVHGTVAESRSRQAGAVWPGCLFGSRPEV